LFSLAIKQYHKAEHLFAFSSFTSSYRDSDFVLLPVKQYKTGGSFGIQWGLKRERFFLYIYKKNRPFCFLLFSLAAGAWRPAA
jgi:hypothetical protein